ncbi:ATP-binding protein [Streptomyces sp. FH025]|uniref:ATP-binding protein n=1 Tax=Streptomyces sp. FH025 TaxID=2815937 RepID=UPI001A9D69AD|nr:ATP-binding protein [Streptomyces sp. FH025]MBO1413447.1 ATP-binding protein [Streptomyces sp. FH025]
MGAVAEARAFTAAFLADVTDPVVAADAALLVSELVGNAIRHTDGPEWLLLVRCPGLLRIEVGDPSPRRPRPRHPRGPDDPGGRGLILLKCLALKCGWRRRGAGKVVWCELRIPAG